MNLSCKLKIVSMVFKYKYLQKTTLIMAHGVVKSIFDAHHRKTDLKVFVVVMPKVGWARVAAPILLLA